jgi:hypothetical protein
MLKTGQRNSACPAKMANGRVLQSWTNEEVRAVVRYEWARGIPGTDIHGPYMAAATVNHIATFNWERLDHAPYSPDLAPSDFYFFPTLKGAISPPIKTLK